MHLRERFHGTLLQLSRGSRALRMTSLFKRSSSNGGSGSSGSGGGGSGGQGQLNNSRSSRQVRRLEFNQAMEDFKTMFPSMDYEVIECVLRSNNGAVDATIDQLLQMSIDGQGSDDSSQTETILERTLEPDSSDEEPPPVYSPPTYDMHIYDRKYPEAPPTPPPRFEAQPPPGHQQVRSYRNWNPPLLGNLPDDFLRILPQQLESIKPSSSSSSSVSSISQWTAPSCPLSGAAGSTEGPGLTSGATEQDKKLKQYLDDERIALFLQNEEFMRELQRNREFLMALERDRLKYESKKSKSNHSSSMENSTAHECTVGQCCCVCVQENRTLQLRWRQCQMTPCSETNSNTWANITLRCTISGLPWRRQHDLRVAALQLFLSPPPPPIPHPNPNQPM
ncbi:hypothetical protein FQN60_005194 [Etheostoma spectabile]|uniref:CUE domain-containing protein n=1 Tax=Etheostoma spectabile TaxID=54343 RepID=A0A5J5D8S0_9PERO|nr:hypothetical protein FQN60_013149 [Etheostoma spectabile]KAA8594360.1 hypothetical protein FQN60_005194 [Etheostoma spectabile]